jgi:hypothetical protein
MGLGLPRQGRIRGPSFKSSGIVVLMVCLKAHTLSFEYFRSVDLKLLGEPKHVSAAILSRNLLE